MATPNYSVNYEDKRFADVEADKKQAISEIEKTYSGMINNSDAYYNAQIETSKQWAEQQKELQQEQTDFAIEKIEHQKENTRKDYLKEQSGAYVDWQKQSGAYGVNAEQMAATGMAGTGYAESSQVSMYNTYQNRVATAREAYVRAIQNYDNSITEARLQNNAALAEIAYNALQTQLELALEGFQYKNQLIIAKTDALQSAEDRYYTRYQDVLEQINHENALAEEVRQYNESLAEEQRQYNKTYSLQAAELQLQKDKFAYQKAQDAAAKAVIKKSSGGGGGGGTKKSSSQKTTVRNKTTGKTGSDIKGTSTTSAADYLNKLIASGASKDKVSNEIAIALREGAITAKQAQKLRSTFTPRGLQY